MKTAFFAFALAVASTCVFAANGAFVPFTATDQTSTDAEFARPLFPHVSDKAPAPATGLILRSEQDGNDVLLFGNRFAAMDKAPVRYPPRVEQTTLVWPHIIKNVDDDDEFQNCGGCWA